MLLNDLLVGLVVVPLYLIGLYTLFDLVRERNAYRQARKEYIEALNQFNAQSKS